MIEPTLPDPHNRSNLSEDPDLSDASLRCEPAAVRAVIQQRLECGSPSEIIAALSEHPRLEELFQKDSRVAERYTIAEHTEMVLRQFDRYLSWQPLPEAISKGELRLLLALHDIGKPIPQKKEEQHRATIEVIESVRDLLPISDRALEIGKALIDNDIVGDLVRACTTKLATMEERKAVAKLAGEGRLTFQALQDFAWLVKVDEVHNQHPNYSAFEGRLREGAAWLADTARRLELPPSDLLRLVEIFYQADTAAYTIDATTSAGRRASPGLEFLFALDKRGTPGTDAPLLVVDPKKGRLAFSYYVEKAVGALESRVRMAEQSSPDDPGEASRLAAAISSERVAALESEVASAETRLEALNAQLEEEVAAARAAIFAKADPELRAAASAVEIARQTQRDSTVSGLSDLANAAYSGRLGRGTLIVVSGHRGSRYGSEKSPIEGELLEGDEISLLRVVPLSSERSLPEDLASASSFELTSNGLIGSSYYHTLLTPHPAIIGSIATERWSGSGWRRPSIALVATGEITAREARDVFERSNVPGGPDISTWRRLLGDDKLDSILRPGDTLDLGQEGAIHWARVRGCLLPTGRWAILTPYVSAEYKNHDEYGEYTSVQCEHRTAGAATTPDGIRPAISPDGKTCAVPGLAPFTEEEVAFLAVAIPPGR